MLTNEQIDEFDLIALDEAHTLPAENPKDWMRSFADLVWNAATLAERERCASVSGPKCAGAILEAAGMACCDNVE